MLLVKTCNKCGIEKAIDSFCKNKDTDDGFHRRCKECQSQKAKLYYSKNREKVRRTVDAWQQSNRDRKHALSKTWRKANKDKARDLGRAWDLANKSKRNAMNQWRRAAIQQATPPWLSCEHLQQIELKYKQAEVMKMITGFEHHVDHIVPLKGAKYGVSGLHVPWNLSVVPATTNLRKHNKPIATQPLPLP